MRGWIMMLAAAAIGGVACGQEGSRLQSFDGNTANPFTYGQWRSSKIGGGGYLLNVVSTRDPQRYYAHVDVGGAYRSDDGGNNWKMLNSELGHLAGANACRDLIVDPRDSARVMIAIGDHWSGGPLGVFVSGDGGETWRQTLTANFAGNAGTRAAGHVLARSPAQADLVLVASLGSGLFRSTDNGESWTHVDGLDGLQPTDLRFDLHDAQRVYLCARPTKQWLYGKADQSFAGGFFVSADAGLTWQQLLEDSPSELLQHPEDRATLYGLREQRLVASSDGGRTWTDFSQGLPPRKPGGGEAWEETFGAVAAGPDFLLTASRNGTFYRRTLDGPTWQKIERQGVDEGNWHTSIKNTRPGGFVHFGKSLSSIMINPRDPSHWFFTDWYAIYQTLDAGRNWTMTINGIEVTCIHQVVQDPSEPMLVHMGMADNGYFRSTNGGETFTQVKEGITNNIKDVTLSPANPTRLYAVGPAPAKVGQWIANCIFRSDDKGLSWTTVMSGMPDMETRRVNSIHASPADADVVIAAVSGAVAPASGGVYQSRDGGSTWTWMGEGLPDVEFFRADIWATGRELATSTDGTMVAISQRGLVYQRDAAATTWTKAQTNVGGKPFSVVPDLLTPGRFYLASSGSGVWRSDDGGRTWTKRYNGSAEYVIADAVVPGRVAAGTTAGPVLSLDGGATWKSVAEKLPLRRSTPLTFAGDRLVIGTGGMGAFWMPLE